MNRTPRRGVALIIAISVLAALLFLALPFLFSQTASVAGARAAAWDGTARRGVDRAAGLAAALSVYATGVHRCPQFGAAQQSYVQLPLQIGDDSGAIRYPSFAANSWRLVLDSRSKWNAGGLLGLDDRDSLHGAIIEDESRRVDPNVLGERAWAIVLARAGIVDPFTVYWRWGSDADGDPMTANVPASLGSVGGWCMAKYGRLARALSWWRPANAGRFNRLEDLLGADPNEVVSATGRTRGCIELLPAGWNRTTGAPNWPPPASSEAIVESTRNASESDMIVKSDVGDLFSAVNGANVGYRVAPLTQAELERLRPFLSFLVPGQGRSAIIDVGTVVAQAPADWGGVATDDLSPAAMGVGLALRPYDSARIRSQGNAGGRVLASGWTNVGDALAIDAPPALNINTVPSDSGMVRLFTPTPPAHNPPDNPGWPTDPTNALQTITSIGRIGRLAWLDGRFGDGVDGFERPALGILGYGIVAIEGGATARDREGGAVANRRRRSVVQAVPQERPLEASWRTQGELEALIHARHGSWIQAGPHPTSRIKDWGSTAGDMAALDGAGWLEPAPLVSFTRCTAVSFDWLASLGLGTARAWGDVLKDSGGNAPTVAPTQVGPTGVQVGALTAQGLRLQNAQFAYGSTNGAGPMHFNGYRDEFSARHLSLRFCLPTAPGGNVTLVEVRNQQDPSSGAADADHTNLWRIEYRPDTQQLVLIIANAGLPWTAAERTAALGGKDWTCGTDTDAGTAADPRCVPDILGKLPFAPADPATRVEFRYAVPDGLAVGQWYHLQAFCASDRPGLHGLALDGVVGRDATRAGVDMKRLGDHYTWPSLRVVGTSIAAVVPKTDGGAVLGTPATLNVTYPADLTLAYDPSAAATPDKCLLPMRGLIRVDDEYFSYTSASGNGGTGTLTGVQRARRVNTNQAQTKNVQVPDPSNPGNTITVTVTDDDRRWPVTQSHVDGVLATPGWAMIDNIGAGQWLRGHAQLKQLFQPAVVTGSGNLTIPGTNTGWRFPATGGKVTVPSGLPWPDRGIVRFTGSFGSTIAAFISSGAELTLEWDGIAPVGNTPPDDVTDPVITATLISMEIDGALDPQPLPPGTARLWQNGGAVQLLSPDDGRCEWVRFTGQSNRSAATLVQGAYLIDEGQVVSNIPGAPNVTHHGWDNALLPQPSPLDQPRGSMRTPIRSDAWPIGTQVLPVQTAFTSIDRLEAGDVLTLVPDTITMGSNEPRRLLVRYAARDGYPTPASLSTVTSGAQYDTKNEWFALAHPVPVELADGLPQAAYIGRGWSGDDLSMWNNSSSRRGALPRLVLVGGASAKTFLGSADSRTGTTQDVIIDDLCAGQLTGSTDANAKATVFAGPPVDTSVNGSEIVAIGGNYNGSISASAMDLPMQVTASVNVFAQQPSGQTYGLCQIDGEVFAYRFIDPKNALLIARGLLGSMPAPHALALDAPLVPTDTVNSPNRPVRPTLPVVRLPLGPIGELCSPLAIGDTANSAPAVALDIVEIPFVGSPNANGFYHGYYVDPPASGFLNRHQGTYAQGAQNLWRAPFLVLCHPAGDQTAGGQDAEVIRLLRYPTQANQWTPCRWLRGLYGTTAQDWTPGFANPATRPATWKNQDDPGGVAFTPVAATQDKGQLNPIVMAWWPRFAPGLPSNLGTASAADTAAILRSRSFAWAGFPFRLHGMRMDSAIPTLMAAAGGIADIALASAGDATIEASVLAAGDGAVQLFDWDQAYGHRATLSAGANPALTAPFAWDRFTGREVDGAELRVHWTPKPPTGASGLAIAAAMQGHAPRLGATDAEAGSTPANSAGIHLRCVAPTRQLAVEEAR